MNTSSLTQWLRDNDKTRQWLADEIGCTYGTLNQWFSKGFPEWANKAIERLMNPPASSTDAGLEVSFSAAEFERIEMARQLLGIATRKEFYEEAIKEKTLRALQSPETQENSEEQQQTAGNADSPTTTSAGRPSAGTAKTVPLRTHIMTESERKVAEDPVPYVTKGPGKRKGA